MYSIRIRFMVVIVITAFCFNVFGQFGQYSQRSLLEKTVYYVADGKIGSASFWSLPIGKFDCTLRRYFPGEDTVTIEAAINFALLSSGYIEGTGYGTRGVATAEAQFAVQDGDSFKILELPEIDYVYSNGAMVKPKKGESCPLILKGETNQFAIRRMQIMIWSYDKKYKELKHFKDIDGVTAFSFTKDGAMRALRAK
jgi:hypothetical protein